MSATSTKGPFPLPTVDACVSPTNLVGGKLFRSLRRYMQRQASGGSIGDACSDWPLATVFHANVIHSPQMFGSCERLRWPAYLTGMYRNSLFRSADTARDGRILDRNLRSRV